MSEHRKIEIINPEPSYRLTLTKKEAANLQSLFRGGIAGVAIDDLGLYDVFDAVMSIDVPRATYRFSPDNVIRKVEVGEEVW